MEFTNRETWTLIHGLILGTFFLVAFAGGLAGLWSLRTEYVTPAGIAERVRRLKIGIGAMAIASWATVITGTWIVYPWYREALAGEDGAGCADLGVPGQQCSPRDFLLSNVSGNTEDWHKFGMEWKEHIAWASPMLATLAAFLVFYYGPALAWNRTARLLVLVVFVGAFTTAAIAGLFGALITKTAPISEKGAPMSESIDTSELQDVEKPTGPVAAALLATGIGIFTLGLLTTLNEASTGIHDFLDFKDDVGPLSGKTILAVIAYIGSWAILHAVWRGKNPVLRSILIATAVLVVLGILGTFPTFFQAFASE